MAGANQHTHCFNLTIANMLAPLGGELDSYCGNRPGYQRDKRQDISNCHPNIPTNFSNR